MKLNYDALRVKLLEVGNEPQVYSFVVIEEIIGGSIPNDYFNRKTFKQKSISRFQQYAMKAGFEITDVDYDGGTLTFLKSTSIAQARERTRTHRARTSDPRMPVIRHNQDLPSDVTKDAQGAVQITKSNWDKINRKIYSSQAYNYVGLFAPDEFAKTRPLTPNAITLGQIITRLVIVNQIDSIQLSKDIGSIGMLARSILEEGIEDEISRGLPISNDKFRSIAVRQNLTPGKEPKRYFSAITKYISRSAQNVYGIKRGYPIFDGVLEEFLPLYIPNTSIDYFKELKNTCDYEAYCVAINNYLATINAPLPNNQKIDNIMFDQIVWYSYKATSKSPKYR